MDIITWLVVGLVAGFGASKLVDGTGLGILGDIVVGVAGALLGGFIIQKTHVAFPINGIAGTIVIALIGAVVLLLVVRLIQRATTR